MEKSVEVEVDLSWEQVVDLVMQLSIAEKKKLINTLEASLNKDSSAKTKDKRG